MIRVKPWIVLFLTASWLPAAGLEDLEFGGYLENQTSLTISEDEIISDVAQVRLETGWEYGSSGAIETHFIVSAALQPLDPFENLRDGSVMQTAFTELMMPFVSLLEDTTFEVPVALPASELDRLVKYLPYSSFYPDDNLTLDRALVKLYFKPFDIFVGRQMIAWGTGYAFNPTDVWNTKNPLDVDAPKVGVNALRFEIPFGSLSGLSLVASPGRNFEHASGGFRYKTNIGRFDMSLSGMKIMNADRRLLNLPKKIMAGADMAGQIGEIGVWTEAALINPVYPGMEYTDFDSNYVQCDAGLDYTFDNGVYVMAEYYYNGLGQTSWKDYSGTDLTNMFAGEMAGFARHYLFAGTRFDIAGIVNVNLFALGNLNDYSAMLIPGFSYDPTDNISVELGGQIGVGDKKKTEYGSLYPNVMLTVTGYF